MALLLSFLFNIFRFSLFTCLSFFLSFHLSFLLCFFSGGDGDNKLMVMMGVIKNSIFFILLLPLTVSATVYVDLDT